MPWRCPPAVPPPAARPGRRPARDLIELVLEHMAQNLEPLEILDAGAEPVSRLPARRRVSRGSRAFSASSSSRRSARSTRSWRPQSRLRPEPLRAALLRAGVAAGREPGPTGTWSSWPMPTETSRPATCSSTSELLLPPAPSWRSAAAPSASPRSTPARARRRGRSRRWRPTRPRWPRRGGHGRRARRSPPCRCWPAFPSPPGPPAPGPSAPVPAAPLPPAPGDRGRRHPSRRARWRVSRTTTTPARTIRRGQGLGVDRPRRRDVSGGHPHHVRRRTCRASTRASATTPRPAASA